MAPTTLTLVTGGVLLTRSWLVAARRDRMRQQDGPTPEPPDVAMADEGSDTAALDIAALVDIRQEADRALRRLAGEAARQGVRLELAIDPGLRIRMPRAGLCLVLDTIVSHAIAQACGGKVMVGAMRHGGRIRLVILDDGAGADRLTQESRLRDVIRIVALQGGTMEITSHGGGSMVTLRLTEAAGAAVPPAAACLGEPAQPAAARIDPTARTKVSAPAH